MTDLDTYSVEWVFGDPRYLEVEYDQSVKAWTVKRDSDE